MEVLKPNNCIKCYNEKTLTYKYSVTFESCDYDDQSIEIEYFTNWTQTCKFMKSLLDDGYMITSVNG